MGVGYRFENELLNALRDAFPNTFSYRFKQSKRTGQPFDLAVFPPHLCFIECKSRDITGRKTLKLKQLFREGQLEGEIDRAKRYGVPALIALELRRGRGHAKRCYYDNLYTARERTVKLSGPNMIEIERREGKYIIEEDFPQI